MRLIKNRIFLLLSVTSGMMAAYAADMPKELFGYYESDSKFCAQAKKSLASGGQMGGIDIRQESIEFIESTCSPTRVVKRGVGSYTLNLSCSGEGEEWKVTTTYSINGKVLTISDKDGVSQYRRCW